MIRKTLIIASLTTLAIAIPVGTAWATRADEASDASVPAAAGVGADFYRSQGLCPSPLARGTRVARGSRVPSGPGGFLLERGGTYTVTPRSNARFGAYGRGARPRIDSQYVGGLGDTL